MSLSYYPPGHPTGISDCEITIVCESCGHTFDVPGTFDAATNYGEPVSDVIECPKCGHVDGDPVKDEPEDIPDDARRVEGIGHD